VGRKDPIGDLQQARKYKSLKFAKLEQRSLCNLAHGYMQMVDISTIDISFYNL